MSERPVFAITGTSRGVGRSMAEYFCESGARVVGCSRGESSFSHAQYKHFQADLTDEAHVRTWVREIKKEFGRIDGLICNVGLVQSALFLSVTPTPLFQQFLQTNITTTFLVCREVSKVMMTQRYGRIVNITSIMTSLHEPGTSIYSATKSAVTEMTKVLAKELAPTGVTCNVVAPSLMETETSSAMGKEWKDRMLALQTLPRPLSIPDLCHSISFFLSPESRSVTGQVLNLCLAN